jgi:hypothetical protein
MHRFVVSLLAVVVVASPLAAQEAQKDTARKPVVGAKPVAKTDSAAGEVVKRDSAAPAKNAAQPATANPTAANPAAASPAATNPATTNPAAANPALQPTYRCKDRTIAYVADSTQACGQRGGVDSVYAKPKP